jgi:hypothetical protein
VVAARKYLFGVTAYSGFQLGFFNDTWNSNDARVSQKRDFVEIHTEFGHPLS